MPFNHKVYFRRIYRTISNFLESAFLSLACSTLQYQVKIKAKVQLGNQESLQNVGILCQC